MIITKKASAAPDLPARPRRDPGAAAAGCDDSRDDGAGRDAGSPVRRLGFVYMPMGATSAEWTPPGEGTLDRALADAAARCAGVRDQLTVHHQPGAEERLPGHARHLERRVPERRQSEVDREHRLLPGHDGRPDRRQADRPGDAAAVARTGDGSADLVGQCDNGYACVYQNNLSWSSPTTPLPAEAHPRIVFERLFGEGGSSADRQRELRKRRQPARLGAPKTSPACRRKLGPADRSKVEPVSGYGPRGRAPHPEGRGADGRSHLPDLDRPVGVPAAYADHARLMFDLQVLASRAMSRA